MKSILRGRGTSPAHASPGVMVVPQPSRLTGCEKLCERSQGTATKLLRVQKIVRIVEFCLGDVKIVRGRGETKGCETSCRVFERSLRFTVATCNGARDANPNSCQSWRKFLLSSCLRLCISISPTYAHSQSSWQRQLSRSRVEKGKLVLLCQ